MLRPVNEDTNLPIASLYTDQAGSKGVIIAQVPMPVAAATTATKPTPVMDRQYKHLLFV